MKIEKIAELRERICKGCSNAINNNEGCTVCIEPVSERGEECPCSICLIKMMCRHSCLEFRDYCNSLDKGE